MGNLTNQECVKQVVAIFHLEGMDIPMEEQKLLLHHLENGTLDDIVIKGQMY